MALTHHLAHLPGRALVASHGSRMLRYDMIPRPLPESPAPPTALRRLACGLGATFAAALLAAAACDDDEPSGGDVFDADAGADADADGDADAGADADADAGGLVILTTDLPVARVQIEYEARLEAAGAVGPVAWSLAAGSLPPGLELAGDGTIAGSAERSGAYDFEVRADDGRSSDQVAFTLEVPRVLLMSGFEPFGEFEINSSWEAIVPFDEQIVGGLDVRIVELPVTWGGAWEPLAAEIERLQPDAVIATGQAGPEGMRFETAAQNAMAGTDNDGVTMEGVPIVEGGAARLRASYPIDEMRNAMDAVGFPTLISANAGTFLCNYVMYRLLDARAAAGDVPEVAGFIHVPPVPWEGAMTVEEITAAHRAGIEALGAWFEAGGGTKATPVGIETPPRYFF